MQLEDLEVDLGGKRNTATLSRYNRIPDAIAGKNLTLWPDSKPTATMGSTGGSNVSHHLTVI